MFCRKCGKEIPDDSEFCYKCGAAVVTKGNSSQTEPTAVSLDKSQTEKTKESDNSLPSRKCEFCGNRVFSNEEFCSRCNAPNPFFPRKKSAETIVKAPTAPTKICPLCGSAAVGNRTTCPHCGETYIAITDSNRAELKAKQAARAVQNLTTDEFARRKNQGFGFVTDNLEFEGSSDWGKRLEEIRQNIEKEMAIKYQSVAPPVKAAKVLQIITIVSLIVGVCLSLYFGGSLESIFVQIGVAMFFLGISLITGVVMMIMTFVISSKLGEEVGSLVGISIADVILIILMGILRSVRVLGVICGIVASIVVIVTLVLFSSRINNWNNYIKKI